MRWSNVQQIHSTTYVKKSQPLRNTWLTVVVVVVVLVVVVLFLHISDTWYRCRREQEDGRRCGKVPVSALWQRWEDLLLWRRLEYDFLACFCTLLPTLCYSFFSLFFFFSLHPGMFTLFVSLRLCSSHLLPSESTYLVFYNTCSFCLSLSFAPYPISEFYPLFV